MKRIKTIISIIILEFIVLCVPNMKGMAAEKQIPADAFYYNGSYYYVYEDASSWNEAKQNCENRGGYLAVITSDEENTAVSSYVGYKRCWFGLYKTSDGKWKWVTGENCNYTNWDASQPDNGYDEIYGGYYDFGEESKWHDILSDENVQRYICEWNGYNINLAQNIVRIKPRKSIYLDYTVTGVDGTVVQKTAKWKSSNINVAKVSSKGKLVSVNPGVCKITCKVVGITKTITVIVEPRTVNNLSGKAKTRKSVVLNWKKQQGVSGYIVYMYDKDLEEYVKVKTINKNVAVAQITGLKKATKYRFKVCAYVTTGTKKYYGSDSKVYVLKTRK